MVGHTVSGSLFVIAKIMACRQDFDITDITDADIVQPTCLSINRTFPPTLSEGGCYNLAPSGATFRVHPSKTPRLINDSSRSFSEVLFGCSAPSPPPLSLPTPPQNNAKAEEKDDKRALSPLPGSVSFHFPFVLICRLIATL